LQLQASPPKINKVRRRYLLLLILWSSAFLMGQEPLPMATVEGIAVRIGTEERLAGVVVELTGIVERPMGAFKPGSVFALRAKSDETGRFRIGDVPPGSTYQLIALRYPEYLPTQYGQRASALPGLTIDLKPGEVRNLRLELMPGASISGRVVDSTGKALRAQIQAIRPSYWAGERILAETPLEYDKNNISRTTSSDREGRFRLEGLAAGQLYIFATSGRTSGGYFRNSMDAVDATPVDVRAGGSVTGIDITLERPAARKISGTAIPGSAGVVLRSVQAVAARRHLMTRSLLAPFTKKGNQFEISVYSRGTHNVFLEAIDAEGGFWFGRATVEITDDKDIRNIQVPVGKRFSIGGDFVLRADTASSSRLDIGSLLVDLRPASAGTMEVPAVRVNADGSFSIPDVTPGDYRVDVAPILTVPPMAGLENAYVQSIQLDGLDVLNSGLALRTSLPAKSTRLQVIVSLSGGVLDGRVVNEKREAVPNIKAVLVPDAGRQTRLDLYKWAVSDDAGRFRIRGIPPGEYKVFSWESVEEGAWQDPAFLRLFEGRGDAVRIEPNGIATVETVVLPPWN
jgi:hypothetical protein